MPVDGKKCTQYYIFLIVATVIISTLAVMPWVKMTYETSSNEDLLKWRGERAWIGSRPTVIGRDRGELLHVFTRRIDRAFSSFF